MSYMIAILDNGEAYSDHAVTFAEVPDVAHAEMMADLKSQHLVAVVDAIDWRDMNAIRSMMDFLGTRCVVCGFGEAAHHHVRTKWNQNICDSYRAATLEDHWARWRKMKQGGVEK